MYIIRTILDFIFPPSPNELLLRTYNPDEFCRLLSPTQIAEQIFTLAPYYHPAIKAAIQATKFEQSFWGATLLTHLFSSYLQTLLSKPTLLIPIPLSAPRERKRGFNQVTRVIEKVPKINYLVINETSIILRIKNTVPQTTLKRSDRKENVKGIFACNERKLKSVIDKYQIKRVIICDDVYTTGATMNEARATLAPHLQSDIELLCIAWAH